MTFAVPYEKRADGAIVWSQDVGETQVQFRAINVTPEEKALITIVQGGRILEEDELSLKRREERIRLSNAAHKMLNGLGSVYPPAKMQHDLLLFCRDLWKFEVSQLSVQMTKGDIEPSEPEFIIFPYAIADAGTIPFAPPGRGKSWTGLLWAVCVDAEVGYLWDLRRTGPVLYINLERSRRSFERRLGQVNEALGLPRDRELRMIHARGKTLADVFDLAKATIERDRIVMVVIDSLSRAGTGSLIKDETANKAMDLANGLGCTWVFLAHTPRSEESHTFGSQMFDAAADITIQMLTEEMDASRQGLAPRLGIGFKVTKANDIARQPLDIWTYEFDHRFGLTSVRPAEPGEWPVIEDEGKAPSPQDRVVRHLSREGWQTAQEIADEFGKARTTVLPWLDDLERKNKVVWRQDGKRKLYGLPSEREA